MRNDAYNLRRRMRRALERLAEKAHDAVTHVGIANYASRESEAHRWVDEALEDALTRLGGNKKMNLGFTGTREGMTLPQMAAFLKLLHKMDAVTQFHHGDCVGSDFEAHVSVRSIYPNAHIKSHPPTDNRFRAYAAADEMADPLPYLQRNRVIVDESGVVFATPRTRDEEARGSGTWATIRYARKQQKPLFIIFPSGEVKPEVHKHVGGCYGGVLPENCTCWQRDYLKYVRP